MPIIFSPGEAETRPLDPDAIVYTTAQKIADLLGIGPSEAVLASDNSVDDGVYVTGADYRDHGFAVGDTILIYSDSSALGDERVITAITDGGASGVKLAFDSVTVDFVEATFTTALNTYVQNTASFTNGKTRGITRDIVENHIKRIQDKIDNITHNAWRPTLVSAEYVNFDTYKPYRRRYYTDYVGTTPLLFRNVQQILKLEVWQGDDYRELAGAEARLEIADYTELSGDAVFLCPGGGGFARLEVGTGTQQWDAGFNKVITAQNLVDLINKEDRTNRGTVAFSETFSVGSASYNNSTAITHASSSALKVGMVVFGQGIPAGATIASITDATHFVLSAATTGGSLSSKTLTFHGANGDTYTQPDGSSSTGITSVYVHNEFIATANADYGNGKLKITSMQQTKGGETATIALTDNTNLTLSQTSSTTITLNEIIDGVATGPTTMAASVTAGGGFTTLVLGYSDEDSRDTHYNALESYGLVYNQSIGLVFGYDVLKKTKIGDTFIITLEHGAATDAAPKTGQLAGLSLVHEQSIPSLSQTMLTSDIGRYSDAGGDQARLKDWWLDSEMGIIYFNNSYPFFEWNAVKVSYIYGERYVEKAIEEATTKLVAADLLMSDDRSVLIPEGGQNIDLGSKVQLFRQEAEAILGRYKEVVVFA